MRWSMVLVLAAVGCSFDRAGLDPAARDPDANSTVAPTTDAAPSTPPPDAPPPPDAGPPDALTCPEGFTQLPTGCYFHGGTQAGLGDDVNFFEAENDCEARGGHLAVIDDATENAALTEWAGGDTPWIGLSDIVEEGEFRWVLDQPLGYTNWNGGEPNDGGDWGDEGCVELRSDGKWNDIGCGDWNHYVCEYDLKPVGTDWYP